MQHYEALRALRALTALTQVSKGRRVSNEHDGTDRADQPERFGGEDSVGDTARSEPTDSSDGAPAARPDGSGAGDHPHSPDTSDAIDLVGDNFGTEDPARKAEAAEQGGRATGAAAGDDLTISADSTEVVNENPDGSVTEIGVDEVTVDDPDLATDAAADGVDADHPDTDPADPDSTDGAAAAGGRKRRARRRARLQDDGDGDARRAGSSAEDADDPDDADGGDSADGDPAVRGTGPDGVDSDDPALVGAGVGAAGSARAAARRSQIARTGVTEKKGRATAARDSDRTDHLGWFARLRLFLREVVAELRKVLWPNQKQMLTYTTVVIVFVVVMVALVYGLDALFAQGVLWIFG